MSLLDTIYGASMGTVAINMVLLARRWRHRAAQHKRFIALIKSYCRFEQSRAVALVMKRRAPKRFR
jgi:hypothetical protein